MTLRAVTYDDATHAVVPREPTYRMMSASMGGGEIPRDVRSAIYRNMIAAAPSPNRPSPTGNESLPVQPMVAVCCGRGECGGECGNEWRGMKPAPTDHIADANNLVPAEPAAWRIQYPGEPDLGHWLSEERGAEGLVSEPLYLHPSAASAAAQQDGS